MINTTKIKIRMIEKEMDQTKVAAAMNLSQSTLSQKINNIRPMYLDEAEKLQEILDIPENDFPLYFFYHVVV